MKKYFSLILLSVMTLLPNTSHAFPWMLFRWSLDFGIQYGNDWNSSGGHGYYYAGAYTATNPNNGTTAFVPPAGLYIAEATSGSCAQNGIPCISFAFPKGESPLNMSKSTSALLDSKMRAARIGTVADLSTARNTNPELKALFTNSTTKVISLTGFVKQPPK